MIGRTIAHYDVTGVVGAGGMGTVYRARDTRLGRDVALKVLPDEVADDPTRRSRFEREARAVAALSHPNIVTIYSVEECDGVHFITMELVTGRALDAFPAGAFADPAKLLGVAVPLADAIGAAHAKGIVHRDLKPQNVMLTDEGRVKVLDFGLAQLQRSALDDAATMTIQAAKTADGVVLGTLAYMSPEQTQGKEVDARSDIFSMGILLYELSTGRHPFRSDSGVETAAAILRDDPPPVTELVPTLPGGLGRIVRRCLAKAPTRRYQSAIDLRNDLEELQDDLGIRPSLAQGSMPGVAAPPASTGSSVSRAGAGSGPERRPGIAVVTFHDHTGSAEHAWLATGLPSMLVTGLAQTPRLDVASTERVHEIAKELGHTGEGAVSPALVTEIGRRAGVTAVAAGSVFRAGDKFRIDVRTTDVDSGKLISGEAVTGEDVFSLIDDLTRRIACCLNAEPQSDAAGVAAVTTVSVEAYRAFDAGEVAMADFDYVAARDHFLQAIAIDPSFAVAHSRLVRVFRALGNEAAAMKHRALTLEHEDRLPKRERLMVQAHALRDTHPEEAIKRFEEVIRLFPDEESAYLYLAITHIAECFDRDAFRVVLDRGIRALPEGAELRNMRAYSHYTHEGGTYEQAIADLEEYERLAPGRTNPTDSLAEVSLLFGHVRQGLELYERLRDRQGHERAGQAFCLAVLGEYPEALKALDELESVSRGTGIATPWLYKFRALFLSRVGRYRDAAASIDAGIRVAAESKTVEAEIHAELLAAAVGLERARPTDVGQAAGRARRLVSQVDRPHYHRVFHEAALFYMGVAEARAGRTETARELADEQRTYGDEPVREWEHLRHWLTGEIALATGDVDAAERAFRSDPNRSRFRLLRAGLLVARQREHRPRLAGPYRSRARRSRRGTPSLRDADDSVSPLAFQVRARAALRTRHGAAVRRVGRSGRSRTVRVPFPGVVGRRGQAFT